jgi:uncharacterized protein
VVPGRPLSLVTVAKFNSSARGKFSAGRTQQQMPKLPKYLYVGCNFKMTLLKFISSLFLSISCLTSCNSQTTNKPLQQFSDTSAHARLQVYRQIFWDSLPRPTSWTNDYEGLFSDVEEQKLDSVISAFEIETTTQFCIVTLDTIHTSKEKFDDLALHITKTWGVGQKDKNNGVTICISKGHRRIRICNGYGIEKILSDQETKTIIDKYFISKFRQGEYFLGTFEGLVAMIDTLRQRLNSK